MSSAWNPNTIEYVPSAHTPDFGPPWIINQPEADALYAAALPLKYWKSVGGIATEMSPSEKADVDGDLVEASRDASMKAFIDNVEMITRALSLITLDVTNASAEKFNALQDAIAQATSLADLKARAAAVGDASVFTQQQLRNAIRNKLGT